MLLPNICDIDFGAFDCVNPAQISSRERAKGAIGSFIGGQIDAAVESPRCDGEVSVLTFKR